MCLLLAVGAVAQITAAVVAQEATFPRLTFTYQKEH
jgi:hypothetical protein